jgi:hypothetical protein
MPLDKNRRPMPDDKVSLSKAANAARVRMAGPGGYYNLGNALGLVMGLATQISAAGSRRRPHSSAISPAAPLRRH